MKSVWVGLVHVRPERDCELIDQNAYVHVVALVEDGEQFAEQLLSAAAHYRMTVIGIEDLAPLDKRLQTQLVAAELKEKAEEARNTGFLRFGTFHTYRAE